MNKLAFKVKVDDKEISLAVTRPTNEQQLEGQAVYAKAVREGVEKGLMLRAKAQQVMRDQGIWDDKRQEEYTSLAKRLDEIEYALKVNRHRGKRLKLSEAKDLALEASRIRGKQRVMLMEQSSLDGATAEGRAEQMRLNYYVSACTVYEDSGKTYFKDLADFLEHQDSDVAFMASSQMAMLINGLDPDFDKKLFENQFLLKYKFVDDKLNFINKDGKRVDSAGRLLDDQGRYVNDKGELVDGEGRRIDENGEFVADDFEEFVDG